MKEILHPVAFHKIMQAANYTVFILSAKDKKFPIFTASSTGEMVQKILANTQNERPQTPDLIHSIFKGLDIHPLQFVLHDLEDTIYLCRLFIEQTIGSHQCILEIDTRPSDGLILALMHNIPIFCSEKVLTKTPSYHF